MAEKAEEFRQKGRKIYVEEGEFGMTTQLTALPLDERPRLVEDLWGNIAAEAEALPLKDAQCHKLNRRLDVWEAGGNVGRPDRR